MALYADFFLATEEELRRAFVGWRRPAPERVERQRNNPFTGVPITLHVWAPDPTDHAAFEPYRGATLGERVGFLRPLAMNNIDPLLLGEWVAAVVGDETWKELLGDGSRPPPLVAPDDDDAITLIMLPPAFAENVARFNAEDFARVAEVWSCSDWTTDAGLDAEGCVGLLEELRRYIQSWGGDGKRLYYYV